ncbi:DUF456 domain-containing protein [Desulfosporosinus lacus]|uniref:DUF456 domain-containing protein n=1 Tax=Desulfosporosinus lacus DSM 15449 TaxID=1121420 RepID=A0A1M5Z7P4_9FIRM|nr:DUF456 domain-containing protein [Desulfosporosinus lacus]SHI20255.1 hypothetical protein SAMN02746098_03070 [Desulfosporosinus lacus DSM 15449]
METTALILSIIFFVAGLLGTILPILPGAILIYGGMLLYGFMTKFSTLDANFFLLQALVLVLVFSVDFVASAAGTRRFNGSKQAAWGAIIGTILGLIFFAPLGIVIGPFLGAVVAELLRGIQINQAIRVGFGTLVGILGGTVLKLCAEILMIVYFFIRI